MQDIINQVMVEALAEALETMAFMAPVPVADELPTPPRSVLVRMRFTGPTTGTAELVAGETFMQLLAANVMGVEPEDEEARNQSTDAFKELLNTTCGVLLPMLATTPEDTFDVTVPEAEVLEDELAWRAFLRKPDTVLLEVDGLPVAARIQATRAAQTATPA